MTKHTKGPWYALRQGIEVQSYEGEHEVHAEVDGIPIQIASIPRESKHDDMEPDGKGGSRERASYKVSETESLANLALIAAAPELLAALETCVLILENSSLDFYTGDFTKEKLPAIKQLIAKVEGN